MIQKSGGLHMGIKIGLDVGITSVGYAVLRTDDEGVP